MDARLTLKPLARAAAAAAVLTAVAVGPLAGAAGAADAPAPGDAFWQKDGDGWSDIYTGPEAGARAGAGTEYFTIEGTADVEAYCVDATTLLNESDGAKYQLKGVADETVTNARRAAYIAINHETLGSPLADKSDEAAATQFAIWKLTNNIDLTKLVADLQARANEILAAAGTEAVPAAPALHTLTIASASTEEHVVATATLLGDGAASPDEEVVFTSDLNGDGDTSDDGETVTATTGAEGKAIAEFPLPAPGDTRNVTATWNGVIPAGSLLQPVDPAIAGPQWQIIARDVPTTRTASTSQTVEAPPLTVPPTTAVPPAGDPTPDPTLPGENSTTSTENPAGEELPYTGIGDNPADLLIAGGALAGLGGFVWFRRRRALLG